MKKFSKLFVGLFLLVIGVFGLASCNKEEPKFAGTAKDLVNKILLNGINKGSFESDFEVPATVTVEGYTADVSWTSKKEANLKFEKKNDQVYTAKVTRPAEGEEDAVCDFTASVTYNNETATKDFKVKVLAHVPANQAFKDFYLNTAKGANVTVEGYISFRGSLRKYGEAEYGSYLWVEDVNDFGGYYIYNNKLASQEDFAKLAVGTHVKVSGVLDEYNGSRQVKNPKVEILEGTKQPTAEDLTGKLSDLATDATLEKLQTANLVKASGLKVLEVNQFDENTFDPQNLLVVERAGKTFELKIDKYMFSDDYTTKKWNQAGKDLVASLADIKVGDYVTAEGLYGFYAGNAQIGLTKVTKDSSAPQLTDKEKAISAAKAVTEGLLEVYSSNTTVELPSNTEQVNYEISLENAANSNIKLENGKLVITLPESGEVSNKLIVKATVGSANYTEEFTIKVKALSNFEKYQSANKDDVLTNIEGIITNVTLKENKSNNAVTSISYTVIMQDSDGAYKLLVTANIADKDATTAKLTTGNKIKVASAVVSVNGNYPQLKVAKDKLDDITVISNGQTLPTPVTLTEKIIKDEAQLKVLAFQFVKVTGKITIEEFTDNKGKLKTNIYIIVGKEKIKYYIDGGINTGAYNDVLLDQKSQDGKFINEGKTIEFTGILGFFNSAQLNPTSKDSIVIK